MTTSDTITAAGTRDQDQAPGSAADGKVGEGHYLPALDGIRAVAVVSVLLFHFGVGWVGGGLLGVDVFFVLSGFLISSLLLQEWAGHGRLRFGRFYARRARRLLPALLVMIMLVSAYAAWLAEPETLPSIRGDVLSTLGYFSNWHFVFSRQSYFVHYGPPSPVLHTWSLAVEEQFYLLWPALTWLVLRRFGRRGVATTAAVGLAGSFSATLLMSLAGVGTSRLYYGTDVRVQELMAGALLAAALPSLTERRRWGHTGSDRMGQVLLVGGIGAAAAMLWMFHSVSGQGAFLYRGGFLLVSLSAVGLIGVAVFQPRHPVVRALALGPVRYVGRVSYGLYLYHYPLFLILDARRVGVAGPGLLAIRLAATFALSVLSFHLLELPVRNSRLLRRRVEPRRLLLAAPAGAGAAATCILLATMLPSTSLAVPATGGGSGAQLAYAVPSSPPPGLTETHRVRVLLLGDSMALTLGVGLGQDSGAWGVEVINRGAIGCDLAWTQTVNFQDQTTNAAGGCKNWPEVWGQLIRQYRPDVVAILLGRFEYQNRLINGHWYTVGQAPWDNQITALMEQAIRLVSSDGAHVAMLTLPYVAQTTDAPDGQPWDVNQPSRTRAWNADVRQAAAAYPQLASVVDLNRMVDPGDRYTSYIDGLRVRDVDNEHFSPVGGLYLRHLLLPAFVALAAKPTARGAS